jgi:hypothetical protein
LLSAEEFEAILRSQEHAAVEHLGEENAWLITLEGQVRQRINIAAVLRPDRISFYFFMVRGPRQNRQQLYRLLLRKNLRSFVMKYCLDADDDVWLVAELPRRGFAPAELDRVLGVFYQESEAAFEALVHLGYPGVFPPLSALPRDGARLPNPG